MDDQPTAGLDRPSPEVSVDELQQDRRNVEDAVPDGDEAEDAAEEKAIIAERVYHACGEKIARRHVSVMVVARLWR